MPPLGFNNNELRFTSKQLEVIELISHCYTNDEIAKKLHISTETVKSHIKNIYREIDPHYTHISSSVCRVKTALIGRELAKEKEDKALLAR